MENYELDLSNINIKTHELDLEKYLNGLVKIGENIDKYKIVKYSMNRCIMINYSIHSRDILRGFKTNTSKKWEVYFERKQEEFKKELDKIQPLIDRFDFENTTMWKEIKDKKMFDYYFPNDADFIMINRLRESSFEVDFNNYQTNELLSCIPEKQFIHSILDNISYLYVHYYRSREPLQMAVLRQERNTINCNIGMDLGKYDLVKYLKNRLLEIENGSNGSQKQTKIELSYDDIFTGIEAKEKAFNAMIELEMIDKNYNYLMGENRSFIWTFIDECIKNGIIFDDLSIKRTPKSVTFAKQLKLNVNRPTAPNDALRSRIRKVFEK
jgi:hypothetical protein